MTRRLLILGLLAFALAAHAAPAERILFVSNRAGAGHSNIWSMAPDGSDPQAITKSEAAEFDPVASPDGKLIAFVVVDHVQPPSADIYTMDSEGGHRKRVTDGSQLAFGPSWSPDGKRIAYCTLHPGTAAMSLFVIDRDGKHRKRLGDGFMPAWSPDGKQILFSRMGPADAPEPHLFVMSADGDEATELKGGAAFMGKWSPDGKQIALIAEGGGNQPDLFVENADGSGRVQLTKTEDVEIGPQWSADGKRILFARIPKDAALRTSAIFAIDPNGKNEKRLTNGDGIDMLTGAAFWGRVVK